MSQFENSEIMVKYAELMQPKTAADTVDYAQEIAVEVPKGLAADLAIGAAITFGKAALLPGVGLSGAGSFVAGSSLLTLLGGPVGIALGVAAGVGMAIWQMSKLTDDNLNDLISRLEDLNPDDANTKKFIQDWIDKLNYFKQFTALTPTTTDPRERAEKNKAKLDGLTQLHAYLDRMQKEWPQLQARLTDWFTEWGDPGQAKRAIDKTLVAMTQGLARAKQATKQAVQEFIAAAGKEKKEKYPKIAKEIQSMWDQLTKMYGAPPTFDSEGEKVGFDLAQKINSGDVTVQEFDKYYNHMAALHGLLEIGLRQSKPVATESKTSEEVHEFAKFALTLGNGQMVTMRGVSRKTPSKRKPGISKRTGRSEMVRGLQNSINKINYAYNAGAGTIEEDGVYGPITAGALYSILKSPHPDPRQDDVRWTIGKSVAQNAKVSADIVKDVQRMRARPQLIADVYRVLSPIAESIKGPIADHGIAARTKQRPISNRDTVRRETYDIQGYDIPTDPRSMINALRGFKMRDQKTDEVTSAYRWFQDMGIMTGGEMVRIMNDFIGTKQYGGRVWDPSKTPSELQKFVRFRSGENPSGGGGGREGPHRLF